MRRFNLAWKDAIIPEVQYLPEKLSDLSSCFHTSHTSPLTRELENIAKKNDCALLRIPKLFKQGFQLFLLNSILISWNTLVLYIDTSVESKGL